MTLVTQKLKRWLQEVIDQVGYFANNAHSTEHSFLSNVRVRAAHKLFNLIAQIARHFFRGNIRKSAECQTHDIHIGMIHITGCEFASTSTYFFKPFVTSIRT